MDLKKRAEIHNTFVTDQQEAEWLEIAERRETSPDPDTISCPDLNPQQPYITYEQYEQAAASIWQSAQVETTDNHDGTFTHTYTFPTLDFSQIQAKTGRCRRCRHLCFASASRCWFCAIPDPVRPQ